MEPKAIIRTTNLSIGYIPRGGVRYVVHDALNLRLFPGEVTCLLGLNGAGMSTLLRTLCGFQPALGGAIELDGRPLDSYSGAARSRLLGVVLTERTNAGGITVRELVSLGRHPYTGFFGRLREEDRAIVGESLAAVGIAHKAESYVSELSDGERQKAMIAKALAQRCPVIILDEPTAFLDVTSRIEAMMLLRRLATEQGKAILLSSHDLELAIQLADRLWLQEKESPMLCGVPEDLILSGDIGRFFGRRGIRFDIASGKLSAEPPTRPIGVEGVEPVTHWVGNALRRAGWLPSAPGDYPLVRCLAPDDIRLEDGGARRAGSVEELLRLLARE